MKLLFLLTTTLLISSHQVYSATEITTEIAAPASEAIAGTSGELKDWDKDAIKSRLSTDDEVYAHAFGKKLRIATRMRGKGQEEAMAMKPEATEPLDSKAGEIEARKAAIADLNSMTVEGTEKEARDTAVKTMERVNFFQGRRLVGGGTHEGGTAHEHKGEGRRRGGERDEATRAAENEQMQTALTTLERMITSYPGHATHLNVAIASIQHSLDWRTKRAGKMAEREALKADFLSAATPVNKAALEAGWAEGEQFCRADRRR